MLMGERRVDGYTPLDEVSHSYRGGVLITYKS